MTLTASTVKVESGRILVRPSFAELLACSRIPGATWDAAAKAYALPVSAAALVAQSIRSLHKAAPLQNLLAADKRPQPTHVAPQAQPVAPEPPPVVGEPEIVLPEGLRTAPWRHQVAAIRWATAKFAAGHRGLMLACGMGVGKSLIALALLLLLRAQRVLIAAPLRVLPVWLTQFERHVDAPAVVIALDEDAGSVAQKTERAAAKLKLAETMGVPFIAIVNYDSIWREPFASWAEKQRWDIVIGDEFHRGKSPSGKASLFFKRLRKSAAYRLALTGTPMPHGPMDIYAQFRFLDITIFGPSFSAFRTKYAVMGGYHNKQITGFQKLDELEALMSRITFRVGSEVLDLPPATHVTYHCDLGPEARRVYRDLEKDFVAEVREGTVTAANALVNPTATVVLLNCVHRRSGSATAVARLACVTRDTRRMDPSPRRAQGHCRGLTDATPMVH